MTTLLDGRYFLAGTARYVPARARLDDGNAFRVEPDGVAEPAIAPLERIKVSARLGNLPRRFELPDGSCFETPDNDAVDTLLRGMKRHSGLLHRLEKSWPWAAASLVLAVGAVVAFLLYGLPATALWLAQETPPSVNGPIARQTLQVLDRTLLSPSKLSPQDAEKAQALFARVAALGKNGKAGYRLLLRASDKLGPNALALPDGAVIMTDELWKMVKNDDEIEGVFAHEIAHVDRAHSLQSLYQAALVPAAIAVVTGDISQISQVATLLPGILVQAAYSRDLEQEADDDGAATLKRLGGDPAKMADLLERMDAEICKKAACGPSWLGSHPETAARAARLRKGGT
jgi:Zn-dependent protease with chaperone function